MNKTFKGQIADTGVERIRLSTKQGLIGYKVVKLQLIDTEPGANDYEGLLKLFTVNPGSTATSTIDLNDPTLIGVSYYKSISASGATASETIIIDNQIVNQDVFLTATDRDGTGITNFYLELEQVPLSKDEATVATLKDMRGRE